MKLTVEGVGQVVVVEVATVVVEKVEEARVV